jgi:drug/metabolite transporter (DMT)-like permease
MQTAKGIVLVALGASSYGVLATFVEVATNNGAYTGVLTFSQFLIGALVLTAICAFKTQTDQHEDVITPYPRLQLMAYGLSLGLTSSFYYISIQYVPVSIAVILLMQAIWMGIVLESIRERQWVDKTKIIGGGIVIIGTLMATDVFNAEVQLSITGIAFGLMAALSYTITMYASNHVALNLPSLSRSKYLVLGGLVAIICYWNTSIIQYFNWNDFAKWGIFLAVFGTILPPILFTRGFPITGTALGSIVSALEIPVSVLAALFILGERVNFVQWTGIAVILIAVYIINARLRRPATEAVLE